MKRRDLIKLTPQEQQQFLAEGKTIIFSTIDKSGYPHTVAMWYILVDGQIHMVTFRKSQKVVNLRRNNKVAVLVESGTEYSELKGLMIRGHCQIIDDAEACVPILEKIGEKYQGPFDQGLKEALVAQAQKRVVLKIIPEKVTSWDHSKLGGLY